MTRHEFDASQALVPGSWQNRQGRDNEWYAASARDSAFGWAVTAIGVVAFAAIVGAVLAQVWRA